MKTYSTIIKEIPVDESRSRLQITPVLPLLAQPGQYYRAFAEGTGQVIPVPLYPFTVESDSMVLCGKIPSWQVGTTLLLEGPYGKGFSNSMNSRRLCIHAMEKNLEERLYSLAGQALHNSADVVWVSDELTLDLPPQIEVLKQSDLGNAIQWSDSCALAVPLARLPNIPDELAIKPADRAKVEVLIDAPNVCGNAQCGVCAVETRNGWKLACKDGPVFPYRELFQ